MVNSRCIYWHIEWLTDLGKLVLKMINSSQFAGAKMPIFQSIFGVPWCELPLVMQKHYAIRPFSRDRVVVRGKMTIKRSLMVRLMAPLLNILEILVSYDGKDIPTQVTFYSVPESPDFHFDRKLTPSDLTAIHFHSRVIQCDGNEVVELMKFGLGWRARYQIKGEQVTLTHIGYVWGIGDMMLSLPLTWLLGKVSAVEDVLTDSSFKMWMAISHPIFGEHYRYEGTFDIAEVIYE